MMSLINRRAVSRVLGIFIIIWTNQVILAQSPFTHCKAKVKWVAGTPYIKHIKIYTQGNGEEIFIKNLRKKNEKDSRWEIFQDPGGTVSFIKDSSSHIIEGKTNWGQQLGYTRIKYRQELPNIFWELSTHSDTLVLNSHIFKSQPDSMGWILSQSLSLNLDEGPFIPDGSSQFIQTDLLTIKPYSRKLGWINLEENPQLTAYPYILKITGVILAVETWIKTWNSHPKGK